MIPALALAAFVGSALAQAPAAGARTDERTVTKASVYLVQKPSFLAPRASTTPVHRGQKVRLEAPEQGAWLQVSVRQGGKKVVGYLHASYVNDRRVAFKLEQKELEGRSTVSGHYNLAVGGFREEVARKRQASAEDAKRGYAIIDRYMPLQVEDHKGKPLPRAARARLSPPDSDALRRFLQEGDLRRQERAEPAQASAEDAQAAEVGAGEGEGVGPAGEGGAR